MAARPEDKGRGQAGVATHPGRGRLWPAAPWDFSALRLALSDLIAREQEARALFHWLPVALGLGVLAYFAAPREPFLPAVLAGFLIACAAAIALRRRHGVFQGAVALAFVLAGFSFGALRTALVATPMLQKTTVTKLTGFVETVEEGIGRHRILLRLTSADKLAETERPYRVRVSQRGALTLRAGDHIGLTARLLPPPRPVLPGGYDFARDSFFKQIGAVGSVTGKIAAAPPPPMSSGLAMMAAIDRARNDLTRRIADSVGGQAGALTAAMITGKRLLIAEDRNDDMRAAGIYHIVSISGLHMVLAAGIFFWLARALFALSATLTAHWPTKKLAAAFAMLGAVAYCVFSGNEVATVRSLIMTLVLLGAILFDRPALSMRNLALSALIVMAFEPEELLGPSFQMSFAAVAALIAGANLWRPRAGQGDLLWYWELPRYLAVWLFASVLTTVIATAATSPFSAYHFHQFNPYGVLGNTIAIPIMELLVMPASIAGIVLLPFGLDGPVWWLTGIGVSFVLTFSHWVSAIPGARMAIPAFGPLTILVFSFGFLWLVLWTTRLRLLGLVLIAAGAASAAMPQRPDIWIDRRGDLVGLRGADGKLQIVGAKPSAFTLRNWLPADGDTRELADPGLAGASRCDALGCVAKLPDGRALALVREMPAFEEDCRRAAIVVTPLPAPGWCKPSVLLVDYKTLAANGTMLIALSGERMTITASRGAGMDRPWWPAFRKFAERAPAPPPALPAQPDAEEAD